MVINPVLDSLIFFVTGNGYSMILHLKHPTEIVIRLVQFAKLDLIAKYDEVPANAKGKSHEDGERSCNPWCSKALPKSSK